MVGNNEFDYSFKQTQFSFLKKSKNKKKILFKITLLSMWRIYWKLWRMAVFHESHLISLFAFSKYSDLNLQNKHVLNALHNNVNRQILERLQFVNYFWQGSKYTSDLYNFRFSLSCKCDDSKSVVHRGSVTKVFFSTFQNSKESTFDGVIFSVKCHTYIHNFTKTDTSSHVFSLHFAKLYRTILYSV